MAIELSWMRADAPYMPIATIGLLSAIEDAGHEATARWHEEGGVASLRLETELSVEGVAQAIIDAPWPDLSSIPWSSRPGQGIKPMLKSMDDPVAELMRLRRSVDEAGLVAEGRLLRSLVTEGVLDGDGVPSRSRLLRGVKADLSGVADKLKLDRDELSVEVSYGPTWRKGSSGRGLGLVPEIQTFAGSTGPNPADFGSYSPLLFRLLWLGIFALPPVAVVDRGQRVVGGPLVTDREAISWPVWTVSLGLSGLRRYFSLPGIHVARPDPSLAQRGVAAVYRSATVPINTTIAVFRWGKRVA